MKKGIAFLAISIISLFVIASPSHSAEEFSADVITTTEGMRMSGKIFWKSDRLRMDVREPQQSITITRMDKKVVWSIMPEQKIYMEMPFDPKSAAESAPKEKFKGEIERKLVGSETFDGHPTKKYLITYKEGNATSKVYQWWATDINFPVKTADLNNKWVQEYRNMKIGPQPNGLFELPSGYKKMDMPQMPTFPGGFGK